MAVFVLGSDNKPLMPCSEKRARLLLDRKRARIIKYKPFTIQLVDRNSDNSELQYQEIKIDPGSKVTGFCISRTLGAVVNVQWLMELFHRGDEIRRKMMARAASRKKRRSLKTRYRPKRFLNRPWKLDWLPPSLDHRYKTIMSWVIKIIKITPIKGIVMENVKFDTNKMQNPEISGLEYQHGTLFQYDVREYLLEKFNRTCVYCDTTNAFFEIDHVIPRVHGGSNRISNLVLSCHSCNQKKGNKSLEEFLINDKIRISRIKQNLKNSLKDVAAVSTCRNKLVRGLNRLGILTSYFPGSLTKFNRSNLRLPKTHAIDAACVGIVNKINNALAITLGVVCTGRGRYMRTRVNKFGNPICYYPRIKRLFGFTTGDIVSFIMKDGTKTKPVRVIVYSSGSFAFKINDLFKYRSYKFAKLLQKSDGYMYKNSIYSFMSINGGKIDVFRNDREVFGIT